VRTARPSDDKRSAKRGHALARHLRTSAVAQQRQWLGGPDILADRGKAKVNRNR
jgi:hypothetical protein